MLLEADSVKPIDFGDHGGDASRTGLDGSTPGMTDSNSGMAPSSIALLHLMHCTLGEPTGVTKFRPTSH